MLPPFNYLQVFLAADDDLYNWNLGSYMQFLLDIDVVRDSSEKGCRKSDFDMLYVPRHPFG